MLTLICQMSFSDGQTITGKVDARFPGIAYDFSYDGDFERLGRIPKNGTPSDLELFFRLAARKCDARLTVEKTGQYELRSDSALPS